MWIEQVFFWTEIWAKYAAMAFTLIESCKMNDINPWDYIIDVLQRVDSHPAREVAQITPKYWKDLIAGKFDVKNASRVTLTPYLYYPTNKKSLALLLV
jgi:hypothetical protein